MRPAREFLGALIVAVVFRRTVLDDGWPVRHRIWRRRAHNEHPFRDLGQAIHNAFHLPRPGANR